MQWILIPLFGGRSLPLQPNSPALRDLTLSNRRNARHCNLGTGLQVADLVVSGPKTPIVSGDYLKYSRFWETVTGDWVWSTLRGRSNDRISNSNRRRSAISGRVFSGGSRWQLSSVGPCAVWKTRGAKPCPSSFLPRSKTPCNYLAAKSRCHFRAV
jgi:hypothetical protein